MAAFAPISTMQAFFQDGPQLANQYLADALLRDALRWRLPPSVLADIEPGLERLGGRVVGDIAAMAADAHAHPPQLVRFDPWGRRIDRIDTSQGWRALHGVAAEEAIVATAFERKHGAWSRLHQFARLYLFNPSSAIYSCPLAMTDGAARVLELLGDARTKARLLPRLTSRDPDEFWTSGQWMTERSGGSDVSGTATVARKVSDGQYRLYGDKWFTSATTANMALTLARADDRDGLSLFCLETRDAAGRMNAIQVHRLKDKLGTRAMPTAELTLDGTPARLLGEHGAGVRNIATMLNITRWYNAVCAVSGMRRGYALACDYAHRRKAFGRTLSEHPLHVETLADLGVETAAALHLVFHLGLLLGREETGEASVSELKLLRLLTPVAKLFTGKQAVAAASETLECFGGAGYIEDTGLPLLLRDAQVLPIWEGTSNVLSLDVQRVVADGEALAAFAADVRGRVSALVQGALFELGSPVTGALDTIEEYAANVLTGDPQVAEAGARRFAFALARVYSASLMLEHADWQLKTAGDNAALARAIAKRWCATDLAPLACVDENRLLNARDIVTRDSDG